MTLPMYKLIDGELVHLTQEEVAATLAEWELAASTTERKLRLITEYAFRNRFTSAEKIAIELAKLDDPALGAELRLRAATLRVYLDDLRAAAFVDLDMQKTRIGVQDLETMGILDAGRAAEILDAEVLPDELPL